MQGSLPLHTLELLRTCVARDDLNISQRRRIQEIYEELERTQKPTRSPRGSPERGRSKDYLRLGQASPIIALRKDRVGEISIPYENSMTNSSMENYIAHLKTLTQDELSRVQGSDIGSSGRPKSVEKYIQKALLRRQKVKEKSLRTSALSPGSAVGKRREYLEITTHSVQPSYLQQSDIKTANPSLAYKLGLEDDDPLLKLHLPLAEMSETAMKAEKILAQHRRKMAERKEQQAPPVVKDEGITRFKISDVNELQIEHEPDIDVFQTAREAVRASGDLERAKMFRIRQNSPKKGPSLRYSDLEASDSPRRSSVTPVRLENSTRRSTAIKEESDSRGHIDLLFRKLVKLLDANKEVSQLRGPLDEFKRLTTTRVFPSESVRQMNEHFLKIECPSNPTRRKIWNFLRASIIFMLGKSRAYENYSSGDTNRKSFGRDMSPINPRSSLGSGRGRSSKSSSTPNLQEDSLSFNLTHSQFAPRFKIEESPIVNAIEQHRQWEQEPLMTRSMDAWTDRKKRLNSSSIFQNSDVYLYKNEREKVPESQRRVLVVELKRDRGQRSPTAQLISLKTARAQAKQELSKIGAIQDYLVVPVTKEEEFRKSSRTPPPRVGHRLGQSRTPMSHLRHSSEVHPLQKILEEPQSYGRRKASHGDAKAMAGTDELDIENLLKQPMDSEHVRQKLEKKFLEIEEEIKEQVEEEDEEHPSDKRAEVASQPEVISEISKEFEKDPLQIHYRSHQPSGGPSSHASIQETREEQKVYKEADVWELVENMPKNRESRVFETAQEIQRGSHMSPVREEVHSREAIIQETPQQKRGPRRHPCSPVEIVIKTPGSPDKPGLLVQPDFMYQPKAPTPKAGRKFHEYLDSNDIVLPINEQTYQIIQRIKREKEERAAQNRPREEARLSMEAEQSIREIMKKSSDFSKYKLDEPLASEYSPKRETTPSPPKQISVEVRESSKYLLDQEPNLLASIGSMRDEKDFLSIAVAKQVDRIIEQEQREVRLKAKKKNKYGEVKSKVAQYIHAGRKPTSMQKSQEAGRGRTKLFLQAQPTRRLGSNTAAISSPNRRHNNVGVSNTPSPEYVLPTIHSSMTGSSKPSPEFMDSLFQRTLEHRTLRELETDPHALLEMPSQHTQSVRMKHSRSGPSLNLTKTAKARYLKKTVTSSQPNSTKANSRVKKQSLDWTVHPKHSRQVSETRTIIKRPAGGKKALNSSSSYVDLKPKHSSLNKEITESLTHAGYRYRQPVQGKQLIQHSTSLPKLEIEYGLRRVQEVQQQTPLLYSSKHEKWLTQEIERDKQRATKAYNVMIASGSRKMPGHSARGLTEAFFRK